MTRIRANGLLLECGETRRETTTLQRYQKQAQWQRPEWEEPVLLWKLEEGKLNALVVQALCSGLGHFDVFEQGCWKEVSLNFNNEPLEDFSRTSKPEFYRHVLELYKLRRHARIRYVGGLIVDPVSLNQFYHANCGKTTS